MKTLLERIQVMQAALDGKQIQFNHEYSNDAVWVDVEDPDFDWWKHNYRVKPEPELVPLELADIMPTCWIYANGCRALVIRASANRLVFFVDNDPVSVTYKYLMNSGFTHSTDGVNFKPCSKTINQ